MGDYQHLLVEPTAPIGRLTLNRPNKLNALSLQMIGELIEAADELTDSEAKVVVVSGAGRAFSSGFELRDFLRGDLHAEDADRRYQAAKIGELMIAAIRTMKPVTIAALKGPVVGGAAVIAAACDLRIASQDTVISIPEVDLGIGVAWGAIPLLVQELGPALTRELVMTCRPFPAAEALHRGFLNEVVDTEDLDGAAMDLASSIANRPTLAIQVTKRHVNEVLDHDFSRDDAADLLAAIDDQEATEARHAYLGRLGRRP